MQGKSAEAAEAYGQAIEVTCLLLAVECYTRQHTTRYPLCPLLNLCCTSNYLCCTSIVPILYLDCTYVAPVLHLICTCIAPVSSLYCTCVAPVSSLYCACIIPVSSLYHPCIVPVSSLYCTTSVKHIQIDGTLHIHTSRPVQQQSNRSSNQHR